MVLNTVQRPMAIGSTNCSTQGQLKYRKAHFRGTPHGRTDNTVAQLYPLTLLAQSSHLWLNKVKDIDMLDLRV